MYRSLCELLEDKIMGRPIWNYQITAPLSLDDNAYIRVVVNFGRKKVESTESYCLPIVRRA